MTSRIQLRSVMRKRMGVGDYRFGASLHREIAQPLGVPFAGFRMTNDGSRDCLARGASMPQLCRAWTVNSNARPKRRVVSGSNLSPSRYCLIGIVEIRQLASPH
jgi:hypothetical protein